MHRSNRPRDLFRKGLLSFPLILALLACMFLAGGCWRTVLTQPDQAIDYVREDGSLREPDRAIAVRAPVYMAALKAIEKEQGRKAPAVTQGTILNIEVFGAEGMNRTYTVGPDGYVDYPLVGKVVAAERTVDEIRREVTAGLSRYFHEPQVIVNVSTTELGATPSARRVKVFMVEGAQYVRVRVGGAGTGGGGGRVELRGNETLTDVLAGNGLSGIHDWRQVVTIRKVPESGKNLIIISDFRNLVAEGETDEDIPMEDGDVVFAPIDKNTWVEELLANFKIFTSFISDVDHMVQIIQTQEDR